MINELKDRLLFKDDKLILLCSECGGSIGVYNANRGRPLTYCNDCIEKHRRKKDKKYYEKTNYWSSPQYKEYKKKKRYKRKVNGKYYFDYSQHLYRGENGKSGKPNFKREKDIVRKMKNYTLAYGNHLFSPMFKHYPKNKEEKSMSFKLLSFDILDIEECPLCRNQTLIYSIPVHSYDYNADGFIMIHCSNCGLVLN